MFEFSPLRLPPKLRVRDGHLVFNSPSPILILGTFILPEIALQVWQELSTVLSHSAYQLLLLGQAVLISVAEAEDAERVKRTIAQFQGAIAIFDRDPEDHLYISFSTEAPDLQIANEIVNEIRLYFACNPSRFYLRPPWLDSDISSEQKAREYRARYTYSKLTDPRSLKLSSLLIYALWQLILSGLFPYDSERSDRILARHAEKAARRSVRRVLASEDSLIDAETTELFLLQIEQQNRCDGPRNWLDFRAVGATLALGQRLGQMRLENGLPIPEDDSRSADCGGIKQQENRLIFEDLSFRNPPEGLFALLAYLRDRGFTAIGALSWTINP